MKKRRLNNEAVKNLSLAEVTKSNTAKRLGIDNTPDDGLVKIYERLQSMYFNLLGRFQVSYIRVERLSFA